MKWVIIICTLVVGLGIVKERQERASKAILDHAEEVRVNCMWIRQIKEGRIK